MNWQIFDNLYTLALMNKNDSTVSKVFLRFIFSFFIVLGGTADFSAMEITKEKKLFLLHHPSGGDWGGKKMNEAIFHIFEDIFGLEVMEQFNDAKSEVLEMENVIELKKREMNEKHEKQFSFKMLPVFTQLCNDIHNKNAQQMIETSNYSDKIKVKTGGRLIFDEEIVRTRICEPVVQQIADHIQELLKTPGTNDVKTIILVGGFAESNIINEYMKKRFADYDIKIPTDPGLAVLKGAVRYGWDKSIIVSRVCDYTYGVEAYRDYTLATDPDDKIEVIGGKQRCSGIFQRIISIGTQIKVDEEIRTKVSATTSNMTQMEVNIYRSKEKSPLFITDKGCEKFASMIVEMPKTTGGENRAVTILMTLGRTEITFRCLDETSGNITVKSVKYFR